MLAIVFPVKNLQKKCLRQDLFDCYPELTRQADSVLDYSIRAICINYTNNVLCHTTYVYPDLFTINCFSYLQVDIEYIQSRINKQIHKNKAMD